MFKEAGLGTTASTEAITLRHMEPVPNAPKGDSGGGDRHGCRHSLIGLPTHAFADVTTGFELDGNVLDNSATTPPDWGATAGTNSIFTLDASNQTGVPACSPAQSDEQAIISYAGNSPIS
jgi:hypothetical protein